MIVWICGISGSGKSTLAGEVDRQLRLIGVRPVVVDGDTIRGIAASAPEANSYGLAGRRKNAEFIDRLVAWIDAQGFDAVVAVQSIFQDLLDAHREAFSSYFEVHLDSSLDLVQNRDPKGLHRQAIQTGGSDVVGYGIPYPRPLNSDLYIDMDADDRTPAEMAAAIINSAMGATKIR